RFTFITPLPPCPTLFPYTTLFRSKSRAVPCRGMCGVRRQLGEERRQGPHRPQHAFHRAGCVLPAVPAPADRSRCDREADVSRLRSEEHTSELQSRFDLVCRLLLEK